MTVFGSFSFFFILAAFLIPTVILGLQGKSNKTYNMIMNLLFLIIIFSNVSNGNVNKTIYAAICLVIFTIWQMMIIKGYIAYRKRENKTSTFYIVVILSILPLVISKSMPFIDKHLSFIGFLGISYLTFKGVQIVMETRDGLIKEQLPLDRLIYFILYFPAVSSGPIDRYRRFDKDISTVPTSEQYQEMLYIGINRIFQGFLYKFIIGYLINNELLLKLNDISWISTFQREIIYMYGYSLYLFFDFAGYSAFAIGVSYIMGVRTPENFNKPFISRNIKDFWNRWHMTLSFWFRDYVYMRLVFWITKKKWIKDRIAISNIGYVVLFMLMGIWHVAGGAALQYIVYGLYHALIMVLYNYFEKWNKKHKKWPQKNKFVHVFSIFLTFNFICFGFYIFSGHLTNYWQSGNFLHS
ncbi:hypothetical protein A374_00380 [Fictibacillus macauensis ZFHKF-1]|uniref:Teichoic acid D-alanyltransferase n=1 Tax=Fictibacillus macauensis ZFHKF-1 TaxID=1196324 RepID=I8ANI6_9BACL|nr:D-alanyl-lipoteichoic acid biosynthesis protein DltB [Fictibacillus macauensis]EIT87384.1 hypothetical protein A374_00380 [Fictibacillus macauensis ZFHKF-1]